MTQRRSILMILNPVAGRGRAKRMMQTLAERLRAAGLHVDVVHTTEPGDAERITREQALKRQAELSSIVACGGDGTVQEVAHALAELKPSLSDRCPTLGVAPAGRCNDFARAFGITRDLAVISDTLLNGRRAPIDLGIANGRHFCTVLAAGIDAEISRYVDAWHIPLWGTPAYLLGALVVLLRYRPRCLRLDGDFGLIERPVFLLAGANTSSYGGSVPIAPDAVPTDGLLDLCIIEGMVLSRALALIPTILRGRHGEHPNVAFHRTRELTISAAEPLELWADGQRVARTPARVKAVPAAICAMVPRLQPADGSHRCAHRQQDQPRRQHEDARQQQVL